MGRFRLIATTFLVLLAGTAFAAEVRFTTKPMAKQVGEKVEISFAVSALTDVEVAILDAKGNVVRHLAAGLLGTNTPAPLTANSLFQSLAWDRKDDTGKTVPAGEKYTVRVGLGLKAAFDGVFGFAPLDLYNIRGLATDSLGQLYVLHAAGLCIAQEAHVEMTVLDHQGRYLRTIIPFPANLPYEKLKPLGALRLASGRIVPFLHSGQQRCFLPELARAMVAIPRQTMVVTSGGELLLSNPRQVLMLGTDGGAGGRSFLGPKFRAELGGGSIHLALSPDEKWIYVSGLEVGKKPANVVYRLTRDQQELPQPFLGELNKAGEDSRHFDGAAGLAVDRAGNLLVADEGNDRISVFSPMGAPLVQVPVEKPNVLAIHPDTGAIYVISIGEDANGRVTKLSGWKDAREVWSKPLPMARGRRRPILALDHSGQRAILWIACSGPRAYRPFGLLRLQDRGESPGELEAVGPQREPRSWEPDKIAVDRRRQIVYLKSKGWIRDPWRRYDGRTGKQLSELPGNLLVGPELAVDEQGRLYVLKFGGAATHLHRYDHEGRPVEFSALDSHIISNIPTRRLTWSVRGLCIASNGDIYVMASSAGYGGGESINVYGPDGILKKYGIITGLPKSATGIRVALDGSIYAADNIKPRAQFVPAELARLLPDRDPEKPWKWALSPVNWYDYYYGSLLKFQPKDARYVTVETPTGRSESAAGEIMTRRFGSENVHLEGLVWSYFGISPVPTPTGWGHRGCICQKIGFDLDGFERVFVPDVLRSCVQVLDRGGNLLMSFGGYGNADSSGPGSAISQPEIPLAWAPYLAVAGESVYLSDKLNRRIVKARLHHTADATCEIKPERDNRG